MIRKTTETAPNHENGLNVEIMKPGVETKVSNLWKFLEGIMRKVRPSTVWPITRKKIFKFFDRRTLSPNDKIILVPQNKLYIIV